MTIYLLADRFAECFAVLNGAITAYATLAVFIQASTDGYIEVANGHSRCICLPYFPFTHTLCHSSEAENQYWQGRKFPNKRYKASYNRPISLELF